MIKYIKNQAAYWTKLMWLKRSYSNNAPISALENVVIFMVDGKIHHGGMADRLRGLVSAYNISLELGFAFKIHFVSPYKLEDYLLPNTFDWTIKDNEISYNSKFSKVAYIRSHTINPHRLKESIDRAKRGKYKQLHIYSNAEYFPRPFSTCFAELFKKADDMQELINWNKSQIGYIYISVTFRFQQLLGDFKEGNFQVLDEKDANVLIDECLEAVNKIHKMHPEYKKVLVTSESPTFLNAVTQFDYVHVIPGDVQHIDFNSSLIDRSVNLKSFVDLFMISEAEKSILVYSEPLYLSAFVRTGSLVSNNKYEIYNLY